MAGEDVDGLEVGGLHASADPVLVEPLVDGGGSEVALARKTRLASLDVFRGLAIVSFKISMVVYVDSGQGVAFEREDGTMMAFVVRKRTRNKKVASRKAVDRTVKLLIVGLVVQGGYFHGLHYLSYRVDLDRLRRCGVLQRTALAYLTVSLCEIWAPRRHHDISSDKFAIFKTYYLRWCLVESEVTLGLPVMRWAIWIVRVVV